MNGWPPKWREHNTRKHLWISVQSTQGRSQQGNGSREVTAPKMVERSTHLDQSLQKSFFPLMCREPH